MKKWLLLNAVVLFQWFFLYGEAQAGAIQTAIQGIGPYKTLFTAQCDDGEWKKPNYDEGDAIVWDHDCDIIRAKVENFKSSFVSIKKDKECPESKPSAVFVYSWELGGGPAEMFFNASTYHMPLSTPFSLGKSKYLRTK